MRQKQTAKPPVKSLLPVAPPVRASAGTVATYGTPCDSTAARARMQKSDRAAIDKALRILGQYLRRPGVQLSSPAAVREFLQLHMGLEQIERFAVLYLDAQHAVIAFEFHFSGTTSQTSVYPRELVVSALRHNAAAVILAHNHPSGDPTPSRSDETLTQTIKTALALVDVRVLDHFVIAGDQAKSMAESGLM